MKRLFFLAIIFWGFSAQAMGGDMWLSERAISSDDADSVVIVPVSMPTSNASSVGSSGHLSNAEDNQCPICLEQMDGVKKTLRCNHTFDEACINVWFRYNNSCPLCRRVGDRPLHNSSRNDFDLENPAIRIPFFQYFRRQDTDSLGSALYALFDEFKYLMTLPFFRNAVIASGIKVYAFYHLMPSNLFVNTTGSFFEQTKINALKGLFFGKPRISAIGSFMVCSFLSYWFIASEASRRDAGRPFLTRGQVRILNFIQHMPTGLISFEVLLCFVYSTLIKKMPKQQFKILLAGALSENALWWGTIFSVSKWLIHELENRSSRL